MREENVTAWSYLMLDKIVTVPDRRATCLSVSLFEQQGFFIPLAFSIPVHIVSFTKNTHFPLSPPTHYFKRTSRLLGSEPSSFYSMGYQNIYCTAGILVSLSLATSNTRWASATCLLSLERSDWYALCPKAPVSGSAHLAVSRCYAMNTGHTSSAQVNKQVIWCSQEPRDSCEPGPSGHTFLMLLAIGSTFLHSAPLNLLGST